LYGKWLSKLVGEMGGLVGRGDGWLRLVGDMGGQVDR
jgi:hypothetical protein